MLVTVFNYTHTIVNVVQFYMCCIHGIFVQTAVFQLCHLLLVRNKYLYYVPKYITSCMLR